MVDILRSQSTGAGVSEQCEEQYGDRHYRATTQHLLTLALAFTLRITDLSLLSSISLQHMLFIVTSCS